VSADPVWFASPANVYEAEAVFEPTAMLFAYVGVGVNDNPPTPVTAAVHGVNAAPVYVTDAGQVTTVVEAALAIVRAAVVDVLNAYATSDPPEHEIVKGDEVTGVLVVKLLVHVGAVPVSTGVTSDPVDEPE